MNETNIEHPTSNAEHRSRGLASCTTFDVRCSMFPLPTMNDLRFAFRQLLKNLDSKTASLFSRFGLG